MNRHFLRLSVLLLLVLGSRVSATTFTWKSNATTNDWNVSVNRTSTTNSAPSNSGTDSVVDNGSGMVTSSLGGTTYHLHSITFNAANNGYDFTNGALVLSSGRHADHQRQRDQQRHDAVCPQCRAGRR